MSKKTPHTPPSAIFSFAAHWLRWFRAPVWLLALATEAKSFKENPIIGSRRLNRAGLHIVRVRLAHLMADFRRKRLSHLLSEQDRLDFLAHAHKALPDPQTQLHSDTFHPTAKAWLFLTDVGPYDGPFVYVPGSLRVSRKALRRMGYPEPRAFAVKKNTLIVADTSGFHARGESRHTSTRIEIWGYGRRNPFLAWTGWDIQGMPGLKGRVVPLYWCARDIGEFLGLRGNPWRRVSSTKALHE